MKRTIKNFILITLVVSSIEFIKNKLVERSYL